MGTVLSSCFIRMLVEEDAEWAGTVKWVCEQKVCSEQQS